MLSNEDKKRLRTQQEKILQDLINAGEDGLTNSDLSKTSLRYGGHLGNLYKKGYKIRKQKLDGGLFRYFFISKPSKDYVHNKAIDDFVEAVLKQGGNIEAFDIQPLMNQMGFQMNRRSNWYQDWFQDEGMI